MDTAQQANPLENFAIAWLLRWTDKGGSVSIDESREMAVSQPAYHYSQAYVRDKAQWAGCLPASALETTKLACLHWYDGAMRELYDLLELMPGGWEAVRAVIEEEPRFGQPRAFATVD